MSQPVTVPAPRGIHPAVAWSRDLRETSRRRRVAGWVLAIVLPLLLTALLRHAGHQLPMVMPLMLYLLATLASCLVGDAIAGVACAVLSSTLDNYFFVVPYETLSIAEPSRAVSLAVYVAVAMVVSVTVAHTRERTREAIASQQLAGSLLELSHELLESTAQLPVLLARASQMLQATGTGLLTSDHQVVAATPGFQWPARTGRTFTAQVDADHRLAVQGAPDDPLVGDLMATLSAHASAILLRQQLLEEQRSARALERDNRARSALLSAVSHDLRTPLAGIKAAVSSLRSDEVVFEPEDIADLLAEIDTGADRLEHLISNLLDMSRIAAGATTVHLEPTDLAEVADAVTLGLSDASRVQVTGTQVMALADPGLLERVVANLVENAIRHTSAPIELSGELVADRALVRVIDHGPGVTQSQREEMFRPFQRYGDTSTTDGVGLGLAVARGLTEAMRGELAATETPGGGLTMTVSLPLPEAASAGVQIASAGNSSRSVTPISLPA